MNIAVTTFWFLIFIGLSTSSLYADIFVWTDDNGVKHFTNQNPPENAEILMKTKEIPFDAEADRIRHETERQEQLERARLELAEKAAALQRQEWEAEQRLANAVQKADETIRSAENLLQEADNTDVTTGRFGYSYWPGYYTYPYYNYNRWYYRYDGNIYYKRKKPDLRPETRRNFAGKGHRRNLPNEKEHLTSDASAGRPGSFESRLSRSRSHDTARSRGFNSGARVRGFNARP